ncbi:unnamed protein product [Acanthoscelides obtectus]|uniref:Uncharacterized protein n=1 Tax=Acanthoscelides obtectus TaxID=200917 RepID=A0A9P0MD63_ACAOB|nr:unnamed protein product [Acanthoscelides obtectus]CAK1629808.1 hypothetical protein AOBTE_LOCUS5968 [Acanthoscelides obtectus]
MLYLHVLIGYRRCLSQINKTSICHDTVYYWIVTNSLKIDLGPTYFFDFASIFYITYNDILVYFYYIIAFEASAVAICITMASHHFIPV